MASMTKSGPLEIWLDRIGDYNPQLMRELRGRLKPKFVVATVGVAIGLHAFCFFLSSRFVGSAYTDSLSLVLLWYRFLSPITIALASHQLIDNLAGEVQQGTINPLRLSPQSSGQILGGKMLGVPVLVYLFNLLCLPLYGVVSLSAGVPLLTIASTIFGDSVQMICWLAASLFIGLNCRGKKSVTPLIGTFLVGFGIFIQNTRGWPMPSVIGIALTGGFGYFSWRLANNNAFRNQQANRPLIELQQKTARPFSNENLSGVGASVATPRRSIGFLEPVLDQIGDLNPQLMRELRGKLTSSHVSLTLISSIIIQGFLVILLVTATAPEIVLFWLMGLQQITIVMGCYQLIKNWTIEEEQGTFNPLRLSPKSAGSIIWGKFLGVPSLIYLFNLSCLPLYLISGVMGKTPIVVLLGFLGVSALQMGFWFSASLLFASLAGKTQGNKAIAGASIVGFLLIIQSALNSVMLANEASIWGDSVVLLLGLTGLGGTSYLCWQAIGRRFHRPSATFGSKGQTYGVTAIVTAICLAIGGLDSLSILLYLILAQGLVLIQPRQILLDWASQPAALLPLAVPAAAPVRASLRQANHRQDLLWGESSPPLVAIGIHVAIVAAGLGVFGLFHLEAIAKGLAYAAPFLAGLLIKANWVMLLLGFIQLVRLRSKGSGPAQTTLILFCSLYLLPLVLSFLSYGSPHNPLRLLTFRPELALIPANLGPAIAVLCLQGTGLVLGSRQLDRDLRRLSKREFSRALAPTPSSRLQES
jgi:ABC-type Na+ efflux pump permease subunit